MVNTGLSVSKNRVLSTPLSYCGQVWGALGQVPKISVLKKRKILQTINLCSSSSVSGSSGRKTKVTNYIKNHFIKFEYKFFLLPTQEDPSLWPREINISFQRLKISIILKYETDLERSDPGSDVEEEVVNRSINKTNKVPHPSIRSQSGVT